MEWTTIAALVGAAVFLILFVLGATIPSPGEYSSDEGHGGEEG